MSIAPEKSSPVKKYAVVGGGISGLATAFRLTELAPQAEIHLFESSDRLGGVLETKQRDGFLIEQSADMFTTKDPWAIELCERLGIADQLQTTNEENRRAFIAFGGKLHPVPEGFTLMTPTQMWSIAKSPLLTLQGKLRMAAEYFVRARQDASDESLKDFATRRLGLEGFERLVQPLIGGIYTADPAKLSMHATMPQFHVMETKHGGLIKAMRRQKTPAKEKAAGARYGLFMAPKGGMETVVTALRDRLTECKIHLSESVQHVSPLGDGHWQLTSNSGNQQFDGVVLATPAYVTAATLKESAPNLAEQLEQITYASAAVVIVAVRRDQLSHALNGFGYVTPAIENRSILAASFASVKFAGRAPADHVLIRGFVGGALQAALLDNNDDDLTELVLKDLRDLLGLQGSPLFTEILRWNRKMPQYHVGHLDIVSGIESTVAEIPGLELAGNAYRGVGIPFCIRSGEQAAERLVQT